jgi:hypothetical protein
MKAYRLKDQWHPDLVLQNPKWHLPHKRDPEWSACGNVLLFEALERDAKELPRELRCNSSGCRQRWAEFEK